MGLDVKEKALLSFVAKVTLPLLAVLGPLVAYTGIWEHPLWFLGLMTAGVYTAKFLSYVAERLTRRRKDMVGSYGKWAVVTGATSGIGEAFAHELAGRGMNVLIISRTPVKLEKTKADILRRAPEGVEVEVLAYDFTRMAEADAFYARLGQVAVALHKKGGIGMLVNNVGTNVEIPEFLHELPESEILNIVRVNVEGTVRMTRAILPLMAERYVFDFGFSYFVFVFCPMPGLAHTLMIVMSKFCSGHMFVQLTVLGLFSLSFHFGKFPPFSSSRAFCLLRVPRQTSQPCSHPMYRHASLYT